MSKEIKGCGVVDIDNVTIVVDDTTNVISVADGVVSLPIATTSVLGGVKPDGTIITVSETGAITVPDATDAVKGVVKQATNQADSTATEVAGIVADFNTLLGKLKIAGLMVAD